MELHDKLKTYYVTAILGVVFAIVGRWRRSSPAVGNRYRDCARARIAPA